MSRSASPAAVAGKTLRLSSPQLPDDTEQFDVIEVPAAMISKFKPGAFSHLSDVKQVVFLDHFSTAVKALREQLKIPEAVNIVCRVKPFKIVASVPKCGTHDGDVMLIDNDTLSVLKERGFDHVAWQYHISADALKFALFLLYHADYGDKAVDFEFESLGQQLREEVINRDFFKSALVFYEANARQRKEYFPIVKLLYQSLDIFLKNGYRYFFGLFGKLPPQSQVHICKKIQALCRWYANETVRSKRPDIFGLILDEASEYVAAHSNHLSVLLRQFLMNTIGEVLKIDTKAGASFVI